MSSTTTRTEYRDRQYSRMLLGLGGFIAIGCGVAIGAVYGGTVRLLVWIVLLIAVIVASQRTALDVVVDADGIALGRARIQWPYIDRLEVLEGAAFRAALTVDAHPNDYRRIRSTDGGIRAWLNDANDPHRAWVASVRDPRRLQTVLDGLERSHAWPKS